MPFNPLNPVRSKMQMCRARPAALVIFITVAMSLVSVKRSPSAKQTEAEIFHIFVLFSVHFTCRSTFALNPAPWQNNYWLNNTNNDIYCNLTVTRNITPLYTES